MTAVTTMLPVASIYALAAIVAWLFAVHRVEGIVYAPNKLFGLYRPVILAFLLGFFPAAILAGVLTPMLPDRPWVGLLAFAAGMLATGALVHRDLLRKVASPRGWTVAILGATLLALAGSAWLATRL